MGLLFVVGLVVLFGAIVILRAAGFFRAFPLLLLLSGLSIYAYIIVGEYHLHAVAVLAACAVPAVIVLPSLWRPASTRFTLWVADGVTGSAICAKWLGLGFTFLTIVLCRFDVVGWLQECGWVGLVALAGWIVERVMNRHVLASIAREPGGAARMIWLDKLDDC